MGPNGFAVAKSGGVWGMFTMREETRIQHEGHIHVEYCGGGYAGGSSGC